MRIYHLIVRVDYDDNWLERFTKFWEELNALGFVYDENKNVLCLQGQERVDAVYKLAKKYRIAIILTISNE